jgi:hypothetical protein
MLDMPRPQYLTARASFPFEALVVEPVLKQQVDGFARVTMSGHIVATDQTVASLRDYGLINIAENAWELIPFSFVVDWFVGVGDFLHNITALAGLTFENGSITRHRDGVRTEILRNDRGSPGGVYSYSGKYYGQDLYAGTTIATYRFKLKKRSLFGALPPLPNIRLGTGLNKKRTLDAISLSVGLLSSLRRN